MSRIGPDKKRRIKEEILRFLYDAHPSFQFTNKISYEIMRDNEFVLRLMNEMVKKELVKKIVEKGGRGKRIKWKLREEVYQRYKELL